jgi:hypothetical protein
MRSLEEAASYSADMTAIVRGAPELALWGRWLPVPSEEAQLFPGLTVVLIVLAALIWGRRPAAAATTVHAAKGRLWWVAFAIAIVATAFSAIALTALAWPWRGRVFGIVISMRSVTRPTVIALLLWLTFVGLHSYRRALRWQSLLPAVRRTVMKWQSPLAFYVTATVVMWFLSFGPRLRFLDRELNVPGPYSLLFLLPGYNGLRVPARFAMLAALCLAAAASVALARLLVRLPRRGQAALAAAATIGVLADGWVATMPLARQPPASVLAPTDAPGAVLEVPVGNPLDGVAAMYRGMSHRRQVVNGFSGYVPPHYVVLRSAIASDDPTVFDALASLGVRHIVVTSDADTGGRGEGLVRGYPGVAVVRTARGQTQYELKARKDAAAFALRAGSALPIARVMVAAAQQYVDTMLDGDLTTGWNPRSPQTGADVEVLTVDLGTARAVAGVELALGPYPTDFPRVARVERSLDGERWATAWEGRTGGRTLLAALADPRRIPLRLEFEPAPARYVRVRQLGSDSTFGWSTAELAVLGPAEAEGAETISRKSR